jgi:hypothetical protein
MGELSGIRSVALDADGRIAASTAERVADVVAGILAIGVARDALRRAGWTASIAGNRITVDDEVFVHFVGTAGPAVVTDVRGCPGQQPVSNVPRPVSLREGQE